MGLYNFDIRVPFYEKYVLRFIDIGTYTKQLIHDDTL